MNIPLSADGTQHGVPSLKVMKNQSSVMTNESEPGRILIIKTEGKSKLDVKFFLVPTSRSFF